MGRETEEHTCTLREIEGIYARDIQIATYVYRDTQREVHMLQLKRVAYVCMRREINGKSVYVEDVRERVCKGAYARDI